MKVQISIIIPCYNEEAAIPLFHREITRVFEENLKSYDYELLFIDDGSDDCTLETIKGLAQQDSHTYYISFSRNFGKEAAMYAGFKNASGDFVAVMDADMQDPPMLLPKMVRIITEEGYDSVATRRISRDGEPLIRSFFARQFYKLINIISDTDIADGARDYRLMKRVMVDAIVSMSEYNRFSKGIFGWIGFKTYWLSYENVERVAGETKWSFWKLLMYAVGGIISFSNVPLMAITWFGLAMTGIGFVVLMMIIIRRVLFGDPVAGWASMICVIIFIGSIQLLCTGIMGQYLARVNMETKKRPHYIIAERNKVEKEKYHTGEAI